MPAQVGRPSKYTEELADRICDALGNGKSLREICREDGIPDRSTVLRWMASNEDFAAKCARTREGPQADYLFDDMSEIESGVLSGTIDPNAARVVLSSKQWRASKLAPKKYGDKLDLNHGGGMKVVIGEKYEGL